MGPRPMELGLNDVGGGGGAGTPVAVVGDLVGVPVAVVGNPVGETAPAGALVGAPPGAPRFNDGIALGVLVSTGGCAGGGVAPGGVVVVGVATGAVVGSVTGVIWSAGTIGGVTAPAGAFGFGALRPPLPLVGGVDGAVLLFGICFGGFGVGDVVARGAEAGSLLPGSLRSLSSTGPSGFHSPAGFGGVDGFLELS